jgi:DNA-binding response OmpR family regulator
MMSSNEYNIACAVAHGCHEFITKPITRDALLARVAVMQTRHNERR